MRGPPGEPQGLHDRSWRCAGVGSSTALCAASVEFVDLEHQPLEVIKLVAGDRLEIVLQDIVTVMDGDEESLAEAVHVLGANDE